MRLTEIISFRGLNFVSLYFWSVSVIKNIFFKCTVAAIYKLQANARLPVCIQVCDPKTRETLANK